MKAGHVLGLGERPDQDHVGGGVDRLLGAEHDRALGGAGRCGNPAGQHRVDDIGIKPGMQERIE